MRAVLDGISRASLDTTTADSPPEVTKAVSPDVTTAVSPTAVKKAVSLAVLPEASSGTS